MGRLGAVAAAAVAAASVAGCGGPGTGASAAGALDRVREAPGRTAAAVTARFTVASGSSVVDGVIDLTAGRARGRLRSLAVPDPAGVPLELDYAGAYAGGPPPAPGAAPLAPPPLLGAGAQPGNPVVALDLLRGAVEAEPYGGTALHGVATFRYEVTVDPARVVAAVAGARRQAVEAATAGTRRLPADVWLDGEGRVRRVQLGNQLSVATTTTDRRGLPVATTVDLFDFGATVVPA